jgi:hypothetical protein
MGEGDFGRLETQGRSRCLRYSTRCAATSIEPDEPSEIAANYILGRQSRSQSAEYLPQSMS